jgi:NAD(P)-dependent dehydrogenase (short-subunit alcohol dehydrogenase family)
MDDPLTGDAVRELKVPLGRIGEPEEIAELVAFLLGPFGSWIHGSIYFIDGGVDAEIRPDRF